MKKIGIYILVGLGVLLLAFGIVVYVVIDGLKPTAAHLVVNEGFVELMKGDNWVKTDDGDLKAGDLIRTLEESEATIIFFETSFVKLFPETELEIKVLDGAEAKVVLKQNSGKTWNEVIRRQEVEDGLAKLISLLGVNNYDVELPNAVASVRGTSFGIDLTEDRLVVLEGEVDLVYHQMEGPEEAIVIGEEMETSKAIGMAEPEKIIDIPGIQIKSLDEEEDFVKEGMVMREEGFTVVKDRIKTKYDKVLDVAQDEYQLTDKEMDQGIDDFLKGDLDLETLQKMDTQRVMEKTDVVESETVPEKEGMVEKETMVEKEAMVNEEMVTQEPVNDVIVIR